MPINEIHSQEWVEKIEDLVRQAESITDTNARAVTKDLLTAVLEFHGASLHRLLNIVYESQPVGENLIQQIADDDLTGSMLLLHDLHPDDTETRVQRALRKLENMFASLGAGLSIMTIEDRTVRLRFESDHTWSGAPVRASIEKAILQAAPEVESIVIEGLKEPPRNHFVPVSDLLASLPV